MNRQPDDPSPPPPLPPRSSRYERPELEPPYGPDDYYRPRPAAAPIVAILTATAMVAAVVGIAIWWFFP